MQSGTYYNALNACGAAWYLIILHLFWFQFIAKNIELRSVSDDALAVVSCASIYEQLMQQSCN